jgi:hypothetical protein
MESMRKGYNGYVLTAEVENEGLLASVWTMEAAAHADVINHCLL